MKHFYLVFFNQKRPIIFIPIKKETRFPAYFGECYYMTDLQIFVPTQTWPRIQQPPRLSDDQKNLLLLTSTIAGIKKAVSENDFNKITELTETFQNTIKATKALPLVGGGGAALRRLSTISEEEPCFDSKILSNSLHPSSSIRKISVVSYMRRDENGRSLSLPYFVEEKELREPLWIRIVPHVCLTFICILYLFLGALMFKFFDPHIEDHPFHTCLMLSFQISFTIDFGNLPDEAELSKLLCIPYATIGIPLMFSTLSNYGRFLAHGLCIYGISKSPPQQHKLSYVEQQRKQIPVKSAFHLLVAHQLIGIVLINTVYNENLGAARSWYFIWNTITMIGLGNIPFHPSSMFQACTLILYFMIGNIFIQAILISFSYHFQAIFLFRFKVLLVRIQEIFDKLKSTNNKG